MKILTWQNPGQLFVAQELINKVKSKCCGIKDNHLSIKQENIDLYYKNKPRIFATVPLILIFYILPTFLLTVMFLCFKWVKAGKSTPLDDNKKGANDKKDKL